MGVSAKCILHYEIDMVSQSETALQVARFPDAPISLPVW